MNSYKFRLIRQNNTTEERFASGHTMTDALVMLASGLSQTGNEPDAVINFQFVPSDLPVKTFVLVDPVEAADTQNNETITEANIKRLKNRASRRDRYDHAMSYVANARSTVEELRDELQNWRDNIPENMQDGSKANELDDAISALEDVIGELDSVEGADVNFPGMR